MIHYKKSLAYTILGHYSYDCISVFALQGWFSGQNISVRKKGGFLLCDTQWSPRCGNLLIYYILSSYTGQREYSQYPQIQISQRFVGIVRTSETGGAGFRVLVDGLAWSVKAESALFDWLSAWSENNIKIMQYMYSRNSCDLTITAPRQKIVKFSTVNMAFLFVVKYLSRFIYSQNTPLSPYVNQLANNALINASRLLNTGIASAMIHANVHSTITINDQMLVLLQLRLPMRSVPRNRRT